MIDRRDALLGLAAVPALWLAPHLAGAEGIHARFFPLLIDLPGWDGDPPSGQAPAGNGVEFVAQRAYARNAANPCTAMIGAGPAMQEAVEQMGSVAQIDNEEARIFSAGIDGFRLTCALLRRYDMGCIHVPLGERALFSLGFAGIGEGEALGLAHRFDWQAMRAALPAGARQPAQDEPAAHARPRYLSPMMRIA
jgi:hypothetical protein